jgi:hypothetical protein
MSIPCFPANYRPSNSPAVVCGTSCPRDLSRPATTADSATRSGSPTSNAAANCRALPTTNHQAVTNHNSPPIQPSPSHFALGTTLARASQSASKRKPAMSATRSNLTADQRATEDKDLRGTSLTSLLVGEMAAVITTGLLVRLQFSTDRRWRSPKFQRNLLLRNLLAAKTGDDFSLFDGKMTHGS